jgi:hypothetical protein
MYLIHSYRQKERRKHGREHPMNPEITADRKKQRGY